MNVTSESVKEMILSEGIDLVGIADARNLITAYPPAPATELMPDARSVIVMAVAHSLGAVYAPDIMIWTRNKMQTSRLLDQVSEKVARFLEKNGYLAMPVSADKPSPMFKKDPATGKRFHITRFAGHISAKHAAVSAGMGQIGRSNLLLTPEYGPSQRLGTILTTAELSPDPPRDFNLCPDNCRLCEKACPVGALKDGRFDVDRCFIYWTLGLKELPPKNLRQWPSFLKLLVRHLKARDLIFELGQTYITDVDFCIECMRACPVGSQWKGIRPKVLPLQRHGAGGLDV
ncbi:MAG: epoxyqueuosine reductase [Deltaproteobacteria bacterium]|nr:epoxyqueuosine reductase [Deltaproteobacteria bacterium]